MANHHDRWRVPEGERPKLSDIDTRSTAGAPGDKAETRAATGPLVDELAELQNRLWAEHRRSVLLVLQAMDAGGKDGTIRKVFTGVNPQGVRASSFKGPSTEELEHDFLWRIHQQVPGHGEIGVFNRSHYEDVLIVRVDELVPEDVWRPRYGTIRHFERSLVDAGTTVVKVFLHISKDEQKERFQSRLDEPEKRWKFSAADLTVRAKWDAYADAYADAIGETSTEAAPWYVVPADRKWYRDWAVLQILLGHLRDLDPQYPAEEAGLADLVIE
ncbi:polyphosphate kinase 2 family protein [Aquihabitans sp. G128]|uniref:PPK2 family polyphosphate kinase n=1 Tax=Aquihabitans sp. G128 TaxID=2849779 RepID=UPI001C215434|nr:PPK2 family polyphosphate kinase [Aquihabitans sp. G128]QXC61574.1 polyphosphate kinase 2 family protein [Aquihabitans sp. G128]